MDNEIFRLLTIRLVKEILYPHDLYGIAMDKDFFSIETRNFVIRYINKQYEIITSERLSVVNDSYKDELEKALRLYKIIAGG